MIIQMKFIFVKFQNENKVYISSEMKAKLKFVIFKTKWLLFQTENAPKNNENQLLT